MYTAVIELDALPDPVGTAAQYHNLLLFLIHRVLIRRVVGGIIVGAVLRTADMHALPCLLHAECKTAVSDIRLGNLQKLAQIFIGEAVLLRCDKHFIGEHLSLMQ